MCSDRRNGWIAAWVIVVLLVPRWTYPQARPDSVVTEQQARALSQVVITATRAPIPAATSTTRVISGTELRDRGITQLSDALQEVAGLTIVQTGSFGGATALYMRGGQSGYTRVLIDGVPVNDPGGEFDFSQLTTEDIDRVEIVRGPASVLYGSDAVSGVVQVFTHRGEGAPSLTASLRGGTYGTLSANVSMQGGDDEHGYAASAGHFRSNGIYALNNEYQHSTVTVSGRWPVANRTSARLMFRYADDDVHVPTDGSGAVVDANAVQTAERSTLSGEIVRAFGERTEATVSVGLHSTTGGFDDRPDEPADTLGFYASRSLDHIVRKRLEAVVNHRPDAASVLTVGASIEEENQHSLTRSLSQFGNDDGTLDAVRSTRATFIQMARVGRTLAWNAGARMDDNDAFGTFPTYRLGAAFTPSRATRVRGAIGTSFREPTFYENFATGFAHGNPHLRPEHATSWEAGIDQQMSLAHLTLSATMFEQRFRDVIEYTFAPPSLQDPNYFNIAAASASGTEVELRADPLTSLRLATSYSWLRTRVDKAGFDTSETGYFRPGSRLLRRPEHSASVSAAYAAGRHGSVSLAWHYVGARDDLDYTAGKRVSLPAYLTLDASGRILLASGPNGRATYVTARIANALDEKYQAVQGFASPRRTVLIGAQVQR